MKKPRVILINGSPRKYGEVYKLLKISEKGILDAGGEAVLVHLVDYEIKPCIGCVSDNIKICRFPCIIEDDFNKIGELIINSDGIVFGTPVYWYSVSGILKNFIDRLTSMENMIYHIGHSLLDGKVVGFIATGNDSGSIMTLAHLMITLNSMGASIPPWAIAYHNNGEEVLEDNQAVSDAYNVGYNIVKLVKEIKRVREWYKVDIDMASLKQLAREVVAEEKDKQYPSRRKLYRDHGFIEQ